MLETLAAIDRALAASADLDSALDISCGECGARVPFHADTDVSIISSHNRQQTGGCVFAGHRICRLPVSVRCGPAGTLATCTACGLKESGGPDDVEISPRWARGCPGCGAGAVAALLMPLKAAAFLLGKSNKTVLRWAQARGAASRDGGRWMIAVDRLMAEAA